ncbi:MAG: helix-turn-helix domain-containing protein [Actinomycetales bacterium]|nr:helix-turn-helix domain-containing protein [Actinomycetales bacterium]
MAPRNPIENLGQSLGEYLREQRTNARLSLRQLADLAGVSNPYLSQIERGLKKPSAEILQELAKGLQISAETLYVKAGFLDERTVSEHRPWDVETAINADAALTDRQKATLIDIYRSFTGQMTHAMERQSEQHDSTRPDAAQGRAQDVAAETAAKPVPADQPTQPAGAPVATPRQSRTRARATKKSAVKAGSAATHKASTTTSTKKSTKATRQATKATKAKRAGRSTKAEASTPTSTTESSEQP